MYTRIKAKRIFPNINSGIRHIVGSFIEPDKALLNWNRKKLIKIIRILNFRKRFHQNWQIIKIINFIALKLILNYRNTIILKNLKFEWIIISDIIK